MPLSNNDLPLNLQKAWEQIDGHAKRYGLDYYPIVYQILDYNTLYEVAAMGGFPTRYPHWRFGMEYDQLIKGHVYGLSIIYEMVINTNPVYAYLLEGNMIVDQKTVMAHVAGHADFFKNNMWFAPTNRKMLDTMANHAGRIQRYIDRYGYETVEAFIDTCLSIENLIDYHSPYINRPEAQTSQPIVEDDDIEVAEGLPFERSYMKDFINPPEFLRQQREKLLEEQQKMRKFPENPQKDVLLFLMNYAPLDRWQHNILEIVRDEAYYFAPQGMTKIINEGWASFWHSRIMTTHAAETSEIIDFADHHAGIVAAHPGRLNPYRLGLLLLRDIEDRWNRGRFGKDWEQCDDMREKREWDRKLGKGMEKVFEVRRFHNDITFLDEFLTPEFCVENKLFTFKHNNDTDLYEIVNRDFGAIKSQLLSGLTNFGQPYIYVEDGNYNNRGELYLRHRHEGNDLRMDYARDTLKHIHTIWTRPVNLETVLDDKKRLLTFDGKEYSERRID